MQDYKQVVETRYNHTADAHPYTNPYSIYNPIGYQADKALRKEIHSFMMWLKKNGVDIPTTSFLDIGCGGGYFTQIVSTYKNTTTDIVGIDYSQARIALAQTLNPAIQYTVGDLTALPPLLKKFDVISTFDVFMHLKEKKDIQKALNEIKKTLAHNGYFLWYDANATSHYISNKHDQSKGFSKKEMIELCAAAGFISVYQRSMFTFWFFKIHSLYLHKHLPAWLVAIIETMLPGPAGNYLLVFKQK